MQTAAGGHTYPVQVGRIDAARPYVLSQQGGQVIQSRFGDGIVAVATQGEGGYWFCLVFLPVSFCSVSHDLCSLKRGFEKRF